jgi:hypothetical protein
VAHLYEEAMMKRSTAQQDANTMRGRGGRIKVVHITEDGDVYASTDLAQAIEQGKPMSYNPVLNAWDIKGKSNKLYISKIQR